MTQIEKKIYAALAEAEPSPMAIRQLYRKAWTATPKIYSRVDFNALNMAIMACFGKEQFRAIHSFGVTGR